MPFSPSFEDFPSMYRRRPSKSFMRRIPIEIGPMEPREPVICKATSAYFYPESEDPRIPRGIVESRMRDFAGYPEPRKFASSGEFRSSELQRSRPVEFSASMKVRPPPQAAPSATHNENMKSSWEQLPAPVPIIASGRRVKIDVVHLGVTAPADMLAPDPGTSRTDGNDQNISDVYKTIRYRREMIEDEPAATTSFSPTPTVQLQRPRPYFSVRKNRFPTVTVNVSQPKEERASGPTTVVRIPSSKTISVQKMAENDRHSPNSYFIEETIERHMELEEQIEYSIKEKELAEANKSIEELTNKLAEIEVEKHRLQANLVLADDYSESVNSSTIPRLESVKKWKATSPRLATDISATSAASSPQSRSRMLREIDRIHEELVNATPMGVEMNITGHRDNNSQGSSRRTSDDHGSVGSDSSQIMSMSEQIVKYNANSTNDVARETNLVFRLERELTEAQQCNHRLNQQLKTLANSSNSTIKKELADAKKQLKDKTTEVEQLKKEKVQWQSKQPADVQSLNAEKQELRKQLEREQNEKHELFMQINTMIAQLAEAGDSQETERLRSDLNAARRELDSLKNSSSSDRSRLANELQDAKREIEIVRRTGEQDVAKLEAELDEKQRQLDIKNASLQSLMLAKQDTGKLDKLVEENDRITRELDEMRLKWTRATGELVEHQSEIGRLRNSQSIHDVSKTQLEDLQSKLQNVERRLQDEQGQKDRLKAQVEELKSTLSSSEESLSRLKDKIAKFEQDAIRLQQENDRLEQEQRSDGDKLMRERVELESSARHLEQKIDILDATLREKDEKIDRTKVKLLSAESRAQQAEADLQVMESRARASERREQQLSDQLSAQGDSNAQVEMLRSELARSEERHQQLQSKLQRTEASLKEYEVESRRRADSMESSAEESRRLHEILEELRREKTDAVAAVQMNIHSLEAELKLSQRRISEQEEAYRKLESELANVTVEKRKLESKASVADEINTLMFSLNSVRSENSQYQEEISNLEKELRETRDELYHQQDECSRWKTRAEQAETEQSHQTERISLLTSSQESSQERLQSENHKLEEQLQKLQHEKEELRRELTNSIAKIKAEHAESSITVERRAKDAEERCQVLQRENEATKLRLQQLEEDQLRSIGSQDDLKERLLGETRVQKDRLGDLESKLTSANKSNESLLNQVQEMTRFLESEARRVEEIAKEKKRWQEESERLEAALENAKTGGGPDSERAKELVAENARLAGELLKSHSQAERSVAAEREQVARQFEEKLKNANAERTRLASDLQAAQAKQKVLEMRIEDQKASLESAEKRRRDESREIESLRDERTRLKIEVEKLHANGPIAPPRSTRTISNMSSITNFTQNDFSDVEDVTRLRDEINKQKRLIIVLRRKLQGLQQQQ